MSVKQVFRSKRLGLIILVTLASLYAMSIFTCTIAFFSPYWLTKVSLEAFGNYYGYGNCQTIGLISGGCRFPYSDITNKNYELAKDMQRTFYCVLGTMCVLYSNLTLTLVAFIASLYESRVFMSFLSVSFGIVYPLGALSVLTASIILEVKYTSDLGFSTILGTISGGLMLLFYVGLRWYDDHYNKYRLQLLKED